MLGSNIKIWNGELHPIYSVSNKKRLNNAESIDIGDHVWIGSDVIVLKRFKNFRRFSSWVEITR